MKLMSVLHGQGCFAVPCMASSEGYVCRQHSVGLPGSCQQDPETDWTWDRVLLD